MLPKARYDAALADPPRANGAARLRLDARSVAPGDPAFAQHLLGWARTIGVGGALALVIRDERGAAAARRALLSAGFCPTEMVQDWRRVEIAATRILDWAAMLPGPADDALFVAIAFRRALGREANPLEEAHFRDAMAGGASREAVLAAITASPERPAMIEAAARYCGL
jgi:hypothetical protein